MDSSPDARQPSPPTLASPADMESPAVRRQTIAEAPPPTPAAITYPFSETEDSADDVSHSKDDSRMSPPGTSRSSLAQRGTNQFNLARSSSHGLSASDDDDGDDEREIDHTYGDDADLDDDDEEIDDHVMTPPVRSADLENPEAVLCNGYLMKKGEKRKSWKKRWFVLRRNAISYYKNEKEYELLKVIHLSDVHSISDVKGLKKRRNVFGVVTRQRTYFIMAASKEEMDDWVIKLKEAHKEVARAIRVKNEQEHVRKVVAELVQVANANEQQQQQQISAIQGHSVVSQTPIEGSPRLDSTRVRFADEALAAGATPTSSPPLRPLPSAMELSEVPDTSSSLLGEIMAALPPDVDGKEKPQQSSEPLVPRLNGEFVDDAQSQVSTASGFTIDGSTRSSFIITPTIVSAPSNILSQEPAHPAVPAASVSEQARINGQSPKVEFQKSQPLETTLRISTVSQLSLAERNGSLLPAVVNTPTQPSTANAIDQVTTPQSSSRPSSARPLVGILVNTTNIASSSSAQPGSLSATQVAFSPRTREALLSSSEEEDLDDGRDDSDGTINDNRVVCEGYLLKQGTKYKQSWKKRWFVLRNGKLTCYKNDGEYVVKRLIPLRNVVDVLETDPPTSRHAHCFRVVLSKRSMVLCADSNDEVQRWINALRSVRRVALRRDTSIDED